MSDTGKLIFAAVIIALALAYGIAQIIWAVECGNAGGAYIAPQNSFPVCVAGVRP